MTIIHFSPSSPITHLEDSFQLDASLQLKIAALWPSSILEMYTVHTTGVLDDIASKYAMLHAMLICTPAGMKWMHKFTFILQI